MVLLVLVFLLKIAAGKLQKFRELYFALFVSLTVLLFVLWLVYGYANSVLKLLVYWSVAVREKSAMLSLGGCCHA